VQVVVTDTQAEGVQGAEKEEQLWVETRSPRLGKRPQRAASKQYLQLNCSTVTFSFSFLLLRFGRRGRR
jgi:hypothetical protein